MPTITFITGNQSKADYLAKYLGYPVKHYKLDLDEIQSLDLREIVEHKAKQAYDHLKTPVLVEDVALEFTALGRLPGTFIKWFITELGLEAVCSLLDHKDRSAVARCVFGYCDGHQVEFFEGNLRGSIALKPVGSNGFGWDAIFIPEGYTVTRATLDETADQKTYLQLKPFIALRVFLEKLD